MYWACYRVPFSDQVLDNIVQVGKGGAQHHDHLAHRLGATIIHARRNLVIEAVGRDQLVCDGEVALVEHLLKSAAKLGLVCFCCCHGAGSFASCFLMDTCTSWFINQVLFRVYPVGARGSSVGLREEITRFWSVGSSYVRTLQVILPMHVRDEDRVPAPVSPGEMSGIQTSLCSMA